MLGRKQELNLQFLQIVDGLLLVIAFWVAHTLRFLAANWFVFDKPIGPFRDFQWLLFVILPFGPILLEVQGFYSQPLQKTFGKAMGQLARAGFWLGVVIAACSFLLRLDVPSRAVMPMFAGIAGVFLMLRNGASVARLRKRARRESRKEPIILAGTARDIHQFRHTFTPYEIMEIEVVAEIDIECEPLTVLVDALHKHSVSRVIFAGGHSHMNRLQEAIGACETEGVEAWLLADFVRTAIARPTFDFLGQRPMLVFSTTPEVSWSLMVKGFIDWCGALVGLIFLSVPMVFVAIAIKITSTGPVIFRQQRGGKNGRPFMMYKFRSMHTDAEMKQAELAVFNQMSGPVFKIDKDPRITRLGRFLRSTSIDEWPQLFNILKGEMSLVGPRPLPLYEVEKFETTAQRRRLSMKPGLTCLWQIQGRNRITNFEDWVKLDLEYIDRWSLWLDFEILFKTVPVVLFGWGAR